MRDCQRRPHARSFASTPAKSAFVVQRLIDAGAIPIGKTNLDQFATGLNGTRSPYGFPCNFYNPAYISGGSSSGSAIAVAAGLVDFALGTDTAGSGRVPAAFNNLVGFKPTRGSWSTGGLVPACRSLDCITVLTKSLSEAEEINTVVRNFDPDDPYSRRAVDSALPTLRRIGVLPDNEREFSVTTNMLVSTPSAVSTGCGTRMERKRVRLSTLS